MPAAANAPDSSPPPTLRERLAHGAPLAAFFVFLGVLAVVIPKFDAMFQEMELGGLPYNTMAFLCYARFLTDHPYVFMPTMFAIAWVYLAWGCRTRRRMIWFARVTSVALVLLAFLAVVAVASPIWTLRHVHVKY